MSSGDHGGTSGAEPRVRISMAEYTSETFQAYVGQAFLFDRPAAPKGVAGDRAELELLEVVRPKSGVPEAGFREPFTLLFALRSSAPLVGGLHRIAHERFEACDWFLNRVTVLGRDARSVYYQAVFG